MLKVGLIGCGFMGGMHSACYKEIDGVEIVAVADVRKEKAEEIAKVHNAKIFNSGNELIDNADVDDEKKLRIIYKAADDRMYNDKIQKHEQLKVKMIHKNHFFMVYYYV